MTEEAINGFGRRVNALEIALAGCQGKMGERVDSQRGRLEAHDQDIEELFNRTNQLAISMEQMCNRVTKNVSVVVGVVTGVLMVLFSIINAFILHG